MGLESMQLKMGITKDAALVYAYGDVVIVPYPTEMALARGFLRFEEEGTIGQIFHEGVPSMQWILSEFITRQQAILGCFVSIEQYLYPAGYTWFNKKVRIGESNTYKAEVGIGFFKRFWNRKWTLPLAHLSCEWALDNLSVDALYGCTPELNRPAVRFFKALGWNHYGPIEHFTCYPIDGEHRVCGAWISCMTRLRWTEMRDRIFVGDYVVDKALCLSKN